MASDQIVVSKWALAKRVYAAIVIIVVVGAIGLATLLGQRHTLGYALLVTASISALAITIMSPETWIDAHAHLLWRGMVFGAKRLGLVRHRLARTDQVIVVQHFERVPRGRQGGWYLGVRSASGRVHWFGYARHRGHALQRAEALDAEIRGQLSPGSPRA